MEWRSLSTCNIQRSQIWEILQMILYICDMKLLPKKMKRFSCEAIKLHSSFWETTAKRKDYLHLYWQSSCCRLRRFLIPNTLLPLLFSAELCTQNKIHSSPQAHTWQQTRSVLCCSTHRWSMNVNFPSIAQRVTNSVGLMWTSLVGWWEPWGRRRHTVNRQARFEVSLSVSPSESSWLLGQLFMYPVQWRVQYLKVSIAKKKKKGVHTDPQIFSFYKSNSFI